MQLRGSNVTAIELAPPGVETKLFRGEFETEMKGQKGIPVDVLVAEAITGIEAGKTEICPGLSNILYLMSRIAPLLAFGQMAKMVRTAVDRGGVRPVGDGKSAGIGESIWV